MIVVQYNDRTSNSRLWDSNNSTFFDFVNGFHDSANSIATVVGTRVLKPIQSVTMAAVANFIGPFVWHSCSSYSWKGNYSTRIFYSICYFCGTNRSNCLGFNYMVLWSAIIKQPCINWRPHWFRINSWRHQSYCNIRS
jgi:hypothetical protein